MPDEGQNGPVRLRASRACQTCSLRKVRCDATEVGLPCSRCRVDKSPNCVLVSSKRGTYARRQTRLTSPYERTTSVKIDAQSSNTRYPSSDDAHSTRRSISSVESAQPNPVNYTPEFSNNATCQDSTQPTDVETMEFDKPDNVMNTFESQSFATPTILQQHRDSLTSMFERFMEQQGQNPEDPTECGIIFMSGASPLTFALEGALRSNHKAALHDAGSHFPQGDDIGTIEGDAHPSHLSPQDIGYLKVKGVFERPTSEVTDAMVTAFVEKFYPSYSIVDLGGFKESFKAGTPPWSLLHAVCFIGATFCDLSVIYRAGFKGRLHARRHFYDKAKLLFDIGYETNKILLLQTVIMLSFWGPQMKSYWNPCSWIGFGVTIAESLGIHRINTSTDMYAKRRSLLKRLFWVLAVRDAYCAALLGRPCRLNIAQCDTEPLTLDDFDHNELCPRQDHTKCQSHGHYQIQVSKLSLILRNIIMARFGLGKNTNQTAQLQNTMDMWQSELPPSLSWWRQQGPTTDIFSISLKIIFHLQLILIHLDKPGEAEAAAAHATTGLSNGFTSSFQIVESAAQMISSTAITIIANSMLGVMPHEIFSGFFVAGIVFYQGIKQPQDFLAGLPRSALDNCQMVISEASESWDPANWVMRIFDFLLSSSVNNTDTTAQMAWNKPTLDNTSRGLDTRPVSGDDYVLNMMPEDDILHSIDFDSPTYQGMASMPNEFFLMSKFLPMPLGDSSFMPM